MRPTDNMRPRLPTQLDKGKGSVPAFSDIYAQTLLNNVHFRPKSSHETLERLQFGKYNLICFPTSNFSFKVMPECNINKPQRCLIDNLWNAYHKQDLKYFIASLNALSQYFTDKNTDKKFKFYVVVHGKTQGVFQTWLKVIESIKDIKTPLFKGFNEFTEALDYARGILGPNYYISPALRHYISPSSNTNPQYKIQKDKQNHFLRLL